MLFLSPAAMADDGAELLLPLLALYRNLAEEGREGQKLPSPRVGSYTSRVSVTKP